MKKFLSFLLFALCLTVAANAQPVTYDFEDGTIPAAFTNDETYPWIVIDTTDDDGNAVQCIRSGNRGVHSSTSAIEITQTFAAAGHISFAALCKGEGTSTAWDKCIFYIDDEAQFTYGAHIAGWNHYAYNVSAGSHTFKWEYKKDNSVNPAGDAFFVDNIEYGEGIDIEDPEVQSTANWYGYATYAEDIEDYFITFSMQDINTVNAATSSTVTETYAACYADGYVWSITKDGSYLRRAVVDNTNHTIGDFETMASNFVSEIAISMSYNPADGKIYAITAGNNSYYLISFDPLDPVSTLGNNIMLNFSAQTLAINREGKAYCIENGTGDLYQLDLSDGSATLVNNTGQNIGYVQDMAFDMVTGELFWAQIFNASDYGMYKVNPATAETTYLGQVGNGNVKEITGLFMVYDNFEFAACNVPYKLNATPSTTTATVSWTEKGDATSWVVAYKAKGETDFTEVTANETTYTLTGLTLETQYIVKVRPVCEDGSLKWSGVTFTTHGLCDDPSNVVVTPGSTTATLTWTGYQEGYNVRYRTTGGSVDTILFEDFEGGLPSGWTTIDNDGDGYDWYEYTYDEASSHSGTMVMISASYINNLGPLTPDNWLITPQIELGNTLRVWLNGQDPNGYDKEHFAIYLSTTGNSVSDFTTTLVGETITTHEWTEYTADLSAYAGQQGYIAIRHFNVTDQFQLNVDDFGVYNEESWTTITATDNTAVLTGLNPETTYEVQVQGICEDGVTAWSEPVEFTTTEEAEPCVINTIEITGFTEPVYGETPDYDVEVPADANYTLGNVYWSENSIVMNTPVPFGANEYFMNIYIIPNEGCTFSDEVSVTINGNTEPVDPFSEVISDGSYHIYTIDYTLSAPSTCETPTNLTATNITATSAKLGWTGNLEQYTVRYKDDAASDWTTATTANSTLALTGLTPATTYTAQVQGDCGSGAKSVTDWSEPVTFTTLSGTVEPGECGPAEDCDGISYPTVKIGDVCWMTKNLAAETCVTTGNVYAYVSEQFSDEDANVETYGLLYDEEAAFATGICPEGYTLPTTEQFEYLKNNFTVEELRNGTGWIVNTGTNGTGFSWDGSGFRNGTSETFEHMLMEGYLWAVDMTSGTPQPAMYKMMYYCNEIVRVYDFNGISASIRCVKNAEPQPEPQPEPEPETFTCGTDNLTIGENSYETVLIGTQCWTKTNMREIVGEDATSSHATSIEDPLYYKVPLKDVALYGYLYNWKAATMVCPTGWHLPSHQEWITMEQGLTTEDVSSTETGEYGHYAGKLATTADWLDDDTHPAAPGFTGVYDDRNVSGFSAIPAGYHTNGFLFSDANANFWTSTVDETNSEKAYSRCLYYYAEYVGRYKHSKYMGESVRCVRDAEPSGEEPTSFNCGTDELIIGENHYPTVQIGTQCWTKTNMRETKDKNGNDFIDGISAAAGSFDEYEDAVVYIPTEETWNVNNSSVTYDENTFGYYYNLTAANNVCPDGWHLPSDEEWTLLENYVSNAQEGTVYVYRCDQSDATSIAKALASETDVWSSYAGECYPGDQSVKPNNATDFSAVPAGYCYGSSFYNAGDDAYFWSSTEYSSNYAWYRDLFYDGAYVYRYNYNKLDGFSVRCLRD